NFKLEDPYFFAAQIKQMVTGLHVSRMETIAGKQAYVVMGHTRVLPEVQLFFEKESGLLVRIATETEGLIGRMPMIYDFSDFRALDGVKVPYKWTSTDISEAQAYTYTITDAQHNVTVDVKRFTRPPEYMVFFKK